MRLTSPFTIPIQDQEHSLAMNKRNDRTHHQILMCPVNGCTSTFEFNEDLDSHIAANLHKIPPPDPRTSNDIARLHLIDTVRSTNLQSHHDTKKIKQIKHRQLIPYLSRFITKISHPLDGLSVLESTLI
ncbi:unnamed protein product [Rotaria magnacalcarata]|nr:unnamed protein product [Rotaria magnacalcarata]